MNDLLFHQPTEFELVHLPKLKKSLLKHHAAISQREKPITWSDIPAITTELLGEVALSGIAPELCTTYEITAEKGAAVWLRRSDKNIPLSLPPYPVLVVDGLVFDPISNGTPVKAEDFLAASFKNADKLKLTPSIEE